MTASSDTIAAPAPPSARHPTRPFYWSLRRELWENRSIYIAPLVAAGVVLFGVLISGLHPPNLTYVHNGVVHMRGPMVLPAAAAFAFAAFVVFATSVIVGVFYCLAALNAERRDRSILFWKSLPVSDLTTVLSKAAVPLVVLPLVTFAVILGAQILMLALNLVIRLAHGQDPAGAFPGVPLQQVLGLELYALVTLALWYAPVWGWLLLASAWAKRMTFLWGIGPPLALCVVERMAFNTAYFWTALQHRLSGGFDAAVTPGPAGRGMAGLPQPDPARFLSSPELWIGLALAAAFLAAAVWLRRRREPI